MPGTQWQQGQLQRRPSTHVCPETALKLASHGSRSDRQQAGNGSHGKEKEWRGLDTDRKKSYSLWGGSWASPGALLGLPKGFLKLTILAPLAANSVPKKLLGAIVADFVMIFGPQSHAKTLKSVVLSANI